MREKDNLYKRETRFIDSSLVVDSTIIIYGGEVSIAVANKPYLGIVIKSKDVNLTFKNLFLSLWEKAF